MKLFKKSYLDGQLFPENISLETLLKNDEGYGVYRIVDKNSPEFTLPYVQRNLLLFGGKMANACELPLMVFQNTILKIPKLIDTSCCKYYNVDTTTKIISPTKIFPGRCFGGHIDHNLYYYLKSFDDFLLDLKEVGYDIQERK